MPLKHIYIFEMHHIAKNVKYLFSDIYSGRKKTWNLRTHF
jgi:hypothetical protein